MKYADPATTSELTKTMRDTLVSLLLGAHPDRLPQASIRALRRRGLIYQDSRNLTDMGRAAAREISATRAREQSS